MRPSAYVTRSVARRHSNYRRSTAACFVHGIFRIAAITLMPLYEYQCKKCHHRFERIVKFSDKPMKKCPDCGGPVEQMISAPAVQFKGSGWYVTDYAKKGPTAASSSSDGDSSAK